MAPRSNRTSALPPLTGLDLKVEAVLKSFVVTEGRSPSQRELANRTNRGLYSVQLSLQKLIAHGRVASTLKNGKGLRAIDEEEARHSVPLLGQVAAGQPLEAIEDREMIDVPEWLTPGTHEYFALRVRGDSMIEDHILDGDIVIVRSSPMARNGERIVAIIDNEATLKRFERRGTKLFLHPANSTMSPIEVTHHQQFRIAGIYTGILRRA